MGTKRSAFFLGVSNEERDNNAYSNFVYSLCYFCLKQIDESYCVSDFNRHDMLPSNNIKYSVYNYVIDYDMLIVLLEEMPIRITDDNNKSDYHRMFNPNIWFELGIAATQPNKSIILISREKDNPFYVKDVQPCVIGADIEKKYFINNIDFFKKSIVDDEIKQSWYDHWLKIYEMKSPEHSDLKRLIEFLKSKIQNANNPFTMDIEITDFNRLISSIGEGSIYNLLNDYIGETVAKFIPGEKRAFEELTKAIEKANESLKTTRFANRSIVSNLEINKQHHKGFMDILYKKSQNSNISSERIICNNNYTKWKDIFDILCYGGDVKVYVRKHDYSTNFELVIVDDRITFIHFYQLSTSGNKNDDGTENEKDRQVINSTLKLEGTNVAVRMSEVFHRLYRRSPHEPSRTLLGIPLKDEEIAKKNSWLGYGMLSVQSGFRNSQSVRNVEVSRLLVNSFEKWFDYMDDKDKFNMCLGIGLQVSGYVVLPQLIRFIKEKGYLDTFYESTLNEKEKIQKKVVENDAYKTLLDEFNALIDELKD